MTDGEKIAWLALALGAVLSVVAVLHEVKLRRALSSCSACVETADKR